ncbi:MAG: dehypoxanthine futalosine cyclase [Bdellovibrionales bacterium]|nr:dehypoxanthine futalosine cyclase [Bdellovibrionales bacterium]
MDYTGRERDKERAKALARQKPAVNAGKFRVCNVRYLNSVPFRSLQSLDWIDYQECLPSECARMLHEGEADLACIPIAEFAYHGGYTCLPFGIVSLGKVDSVLLLSEKPLSELDTICVDSASQTSVALLRLLLSNSGNSKAVRFWRMDAQEALGRIGGSVGALLIGNSAYHARGSLPFELDLSQRWFEQTGLPFVFAVWAMRPGALDDERCAELIAVLREGIDNRTFFARQWADEEKTDREAAVDYVTSCISYDLDDDVLCGAHEFLNKGSSYGLFPARASLPVPYLPAGRGAAAIQTPARSIDSILADSAAGRRISIDEALRLAADAPFSDICLAADERRAAQHPNNDVSYIVDRNINYTNVCNVYCRFCAFYSAPGKEGGYLLSKDEIGKKIEEMMAAGGIQILLQGGLHPELGIDYYEDLFKWIKSNYPINLHALSADEVWHISRVSNLSLDEVISRLIAAGLGSLPGGGAEILIDGVRRRIARLKTTAQDWLEVHRVAHRLGITSTCTMMFGVQETWNDRFNHMHKLRQLQDETGGFTAFITWPYQEEKGATRLRKSNTSAVEYLRVQALSRLFIDNIPNIQSSWVTMGAGIGQLALFFGANDFGSVMFEENVVSSAGTTYSMNAESIERHIIEAGFVPFRRDVHYNKLESKSSLSTSATQGASS